MEETKKCKCCGRELPISQFNRGGFGIHNTYKECVSKHKKGARARKREVRNFEQEIADAKKMRQQDFTPRDLMLRLKELGYDGYIDIPQTTYKRIKLQDEF